MIPGENLDVAQQQQQHSSRVSLLASRGVHERAAILFFCCHIHGDFIEPFLITVIQAFIAAGCRRKRKHEHWHVCVCAHCIMRWPQDLSATRQYQRTWQLTLLLSDVAASCTASLSSSRHPLIRMEVEHWSAARQGGGSLRALAPKGPWR